MASEDRPEGPPPKRIRLSTPDEFVAESNGKPLQLAAQNGQDDEDQLQKEIKAGITAFINPKTPGFTGILKQR
jgi:hypothetical protein